MHVSCFTIEIVIVHYELNVGGMSIFHPEQNNNYTKDGPHNCGGFVHIE